MHIDELIRHAVARWNWLPQDCRNARRWSAAQLAPLVALMQTELASGEDEPIAIANHPHPAGRYPVAAAASVQPAASPWRLMLDVAIREGQRWFEQRQIAAGVC